MNISLPITGNYNAVFGAKNKNIRTADNILRASKNTFPSVSASYLEKFYLTDKKNSQSKEKIRSISGRIFEKISIIRDLAEKLVSPEVKLSEEERNIMYAPVLRGISELKSANCYEMSSAALSALTANGFYDSKIVNLYVETTYKNKEDGSIEYSTKDPLDHCFVVTSMGKNSSDNRDLIVVDPWLSYCDSLSSAIGRYKQLYQDNTMNIIKNMNRSLFRMEKLMQGKEFDDANYILSQKLVLVTADVTSDKELRQLGEYSRKTFPSLVI